MQGILGLGLLGEVEGFSLDGQNWKRRKREKGKVNDRIRMEQLLTFYCFFRSLSVCHGDHLALRKNAMFRQYWRAVNYFVVKLSDPTRRKYFFLVSEAEWVMHLIVMCHQLSQTRLSNKTWCVAHTSSRTLKSFIPPHDAVYRLCVRDMFSALFTRVSVEKMTRVWLGLR